MADGTAIMRMGRELLVSLHGDLDDSTVGSLEREITNEVARTHANGVLIDVSGLEMVDSFVAQALARLAGMVRLLGAEATIVGIRPPVAITLVQLGMSLADVSTALNPEQGLSRLRRGGGRTGDDHHL